MTKQLSSRPSFNKVGQIHLSQAGFHLLPTSLSTPERADYEAMVRAIKGNRFITLRIETVVSLEAFKKILDRWFRRIHRGLYRKPPEECGPDLKIRIFGFLEPSDTRDGKWHAHLSVRVPDEYLARFDYVAATRWKKFGKAYTFHVLEQVETADDLSRVGHYVTKFNRLKERWWGFDPADRGMSNIPGRHHSLRVLSSITGPRPDFHCAPAKPVPKRSETQVKRKRPKQTCPAPTIIRKKQRPLVGFSTRPA